jgi:hypothetical protein
MAYDKDSKGPLQERRTTQRDRNWAGKKAKPFGLRLTYEAPWALMAWVSTNWYPSQVAREQAEKTLARANQHPWKLLPKQIERVER